MKIIGIILVSLMLSACGGSGGEAPNNPDNKPTVDYVNWEAVPSKYSKKIEEFGMVDMLGEVFEVNFFGFQNDVRLKYVNDLPKDSARIGIYWIYKNSMNAGQNDFRDVGNTLRLNKYGSYSCSLNIENKILKELEGACIVRVVIELPAEQVTEVYNSGKLISSRFFPMTISKLLEELDKASWDEDKFNIIAEFDYSYKQTRKRIEMRSSDLGRIIEEFSRSENKLRILEGFYKTVTDRENLESMIDYCFWGFDKEKARKIVGLNLGKIKKQR